MAKAKKKDEIDDLVDDLDELEDEDVADDDDEDEDEVEEVEVEDDDDEEEDDDEDDPDEKPTKAKSKGKSKAKAKKAKKEGIGTKEVADEAGIEPRKLRMFLRAKGYQPRGDRDGRYEWSSLNHPEVKKILKAVAADQAKAETKAAKAEADEEVVVKKVKKKKKAKA